MNREREARLVVRGGRKLLGEVTVHGAKNAVLPMLAAGMLSDEPVTLTDCPRITDVEDMATMLGALGCAVTREGRSMTVCGGCLGSETPAELAGAMRSSVFMLAPMLVRTGEARMHAPGGCRIGARPTDIHLDGLRRLGAKISEEDGCIVCRADRLKGADIVLRYPSVGATENLLMAATAAEGRTRIIGAAREPEISSLADLLRKMGAAVGGEGTPVLTVEGAGRLSGAVAAPVPDRIVAATVLTAVAVCGGKVALSGAQIGHLGAVLSRLLSGGTRLTEHGGVLIFESDGVPSPCRIETGPYPLFPTDMQAPLMAYMCFARGTSSVRETVFESRFAHAAELAKMGAEIGVAGSYAFVNGRGELKGARVHAPDLRGGAGLVIAALAADGESVISGVGHIDRGYERIEELFSSLGADIVRTGE